MRAIFIHPHFPGQFGHLAQFLDNDPKNMVFFITKKIAPEWNISGIKKIILPDTSGPSTRFTFNQAAANGRAVANILTALKNQNGKPDLICGHSGCGMTLYVKDIFPKTPFLGYFEWYYNATWKDMSFRKQFSLDSATQIRSKSKNLPILNDLVACDIGLCPTHWQKSQFPKEFHSKLSVIHDGINTDFFIPAPDQKLKLKSLDLSHAREIITCMARREDPSRDFPRFIDSIPHILEKRPDVHIVIVEENQRYDSPNPSIKHTSRAKDAQEFNLNPHQVHFLDSLSLEDYLRVLQSSSVHVYLTFPFILSWSLLEAMSCECLVVASDTSPVKEVIHDGVNGILNDSSSPEKIARKVVTCLEYPSFMKTVKKNARKTILEKYRLDHLLSNQIDLMTQLIRASKGFRRFG
jgi:glycosyltransferase involved in cell wall biosynthesis